MPGQTISEVLKIRPMVDLIRIKEAVLGFYKSSSEDRAAEIRRVESDPDVMADERTPSLLALLKAFHKLRSPFNQRVAIRDLEAEVLADRVNLKRGE